MPIIQLEKKFTTDESPHVHCLECERSEGKYKILKVVVKLEMSRYFNTSSCMKVFDTILNLLILLYF